MFMPYVTGVITSHLLLFAQFPWVFICVEQKSRLVHVQLQVESFLRSVQKNIPIKYV